MKKTIALASLFTLAAGGSAMALVATPPSVPEIDALSSLAALAVVGGALSLIWERRRK